MIKQGDFTESESYARESSHLLEVVDVMALIIAWDNVKS